MAAEIDLDGYFRRIGYTGERSPTLDTLRAIHLRHTEAIPFENLNPLLRWPVRLDAASLEQKLVRDGRGGYCFEQNTLLLHVLRGLGFTAVGLAARILWNIPEGTITPRTHMLLRVEVEEGSYLADVGFGGQVMTGPLKFEPDTKQATPHEPFRLVRAGDQFVMQSEILGTWKPLYRFDLQEQFLPDYELSNWYLSNHPESHFVNDLFAARPAPGLRYTLRNNALAVHHRDGSTERRVLAGAAELREALQGPIKLTLPDSPELDAILARIAARPV